MSTIRIDLNSNDWRASRLSNLSHSPFVIGGQEFASVEGFIQHLNFRYGDFRKELCTELDGADAAAMGYQAEQVWEDRMSSAMSCFYEGEYLGFHSPLWESTVEAAIRAKFEQHAPSRKALLRTRGFELEYEVDPMRMNTSIDPRLFLKILNRIREEMEDDDGGQEGAV